MRAADVFIQNNGDVTKQYYRALDSRGPAGQLATALFRAQKRSAAAKRYRGRQFRGSAYDVKNWSMQEVCRILLLHGVAMGINWGWKRDEKAIGFEDVLYVELPEGQVSFHSAGRYEGPVYAGDWDGQRKSQERIIEFCQRIYDTVPVSLSLESDGPQGRAVQGAGAGQT